MSQFSKPILALDTSAGASVCLMLADGSVSSASMHSPRAHSRELLPLLQNLIQAQNLNWQDLGGFAVGTGPGSFTGLRVACATIAGINASLKQPVYSLSSLAITAKQADISTPLWAIEDARSGLVYAALYEQETCLFEPKCMTWDEFSALKPEQCISISALPFSDMAWDVLPVKNSREQALIHAVKQLNMNEPHDLWVEPVYLQVSQAEKNYVK